MKNNLEIITLKKNNIKNFAKERNILLRNSKSDWVFFKDSDEVISKKLLKEIKSATRNDKVNGYYVFRKNFLFGKYAGTDKILRLGRKERGKWVRAVHEVWIVSGNKGELKNFLVHRDNSSVSDLVKKINNYSDIHALENRKEGKRSDLVKIIFFPIFKFIQSIFEGRSVAMSVLQSFHSLLSWLKLWELQKD